MDKVHQLCVRECAMRLATKDTPDDYVETTAEAKSLFAYRRKLYKQYLTKLTK